MLCALKSDLERTQFIIASPIGTALIPTQGSCLPLTEIFVFLPFLSIVFLLVKIDDVGLTANEATIYFDLKKFHLKFHLLD